TEVGYRHDMTGRLSATASLLYDLPRIGRFRPYLAAGAGLEEYATALRLPDGALAAQPRKAFAINAGGGLKVPVDDNWGIRTDARWFNGLGRDAGEHWRLYNGVTFPTGWLTHRSEADRRWLLLCAMCIFACILFGRHLPLSSRSWAHD